ncbi:predicted protein [Postia placenta Mad-698-R]|nr:predicted protein [Postia placenta Mad-698-R]
MTGVSLVAANLTTICLESFFYGIFFVLALASIYILAHRNSHSDPLAPPRSWIQALRSIITSPMLLAAAGLFIGNTAHWALGVMRLFQAFLYYEGGTKPTQFYGDLSQKTYIAQLSALAFCIILGDAILVYRLWIVWAYRKSVIMIPICSLIGLVVCNIGVTYQTSRFRPGDNVNQVSAVAWITPLWAFTICTVLIAWRVWREHLEISKSFGSRKIMRAVVTLIESAMLYTAWNIFYYVVYQLQSELQFIANQTTPGICGIAFMLINGSEATADDRPHEGIEFERMKIVTTAIDNSEPLSVSLEDKTMRFQFHHAPTTYMQCSLVSIKKHVNQYRCEATVGYMQLLSTSKPWAAADPANEVFILYDGGTTPGSLWTSGISLIVLANWACSGLACNDVSSSLRAPPVSILPASHWDTVAPNFEGAKPRLSVEKTWSQKPVTILASGVILYPSAISTRKKPHNTYTTVNSMVAFTSGMYQSHSQHYGQLPPPATDPSLLAIPTPVTAPSRTPSMTSGPAKAEQDGTTSTMIQCGTKRGREAEGAPHVVVATATESAPSKKKRLRTGRRKPHGHATSQARMDMKSGGNQPPSPKPPRQGTVHPIYLYLEEESEEQRPYPCIMKGCTYLIPLGRAAPWKHMEACHPDVAQTWKCPSPSCKDEAPKVSGDAVGRHVQTAHAPVRIWQCPKCWKKSKPRTRKEYWVRQCDSCNASGLSDSATSASKQSSSSVLNELEQNGSTKTSPKGGEKETTTQTLDDAPYAVIEFTVLVVSMRTSTYLPLREQSRAYSEVYTLHLRCNLKPSHGSSMGDNIPVVPFEFPAKS